MDSPRQSSSGTNGFTVFEIIASIAVIVILMTALAVELGGLMPLSESKQANTDIVRIQQALEQYKENFGEYPKKVSVGGGAPAMETILFNALGGSLAPNGKLGNFPSLLDRMSLDFQNGSFPVTGGVPALISNAIVDPWGNPYRYRYDPDDSNWENFNYVLFSAGPDGLYTDVTAAGQNNEGAASNDDNVYAE
jgi:general secretion pathway protein G